MCKTVPSSGILGFLVVGVLGLACSMPFVAEQMDAAIEAARDMAQDAAVPASMGQVGGSLPVGFYAKQCQWDACEPVPERASPASRPLR